MHALGTKNDNTSPINDDVENNTSLPPQEGTEADGSRLLAQPRSGSFQALQQGFFYSSSRDTCANSAALCGGLIVIEGFATAGTTLSAAVGTATLTAMGSEDFDLNRIVQAAALGGVIVPPMYAVALLMLDFLFIFICRCRLQPDVALSPSSIVSSVLTFNTLAGAVGAWALGHDAEEIQHAAVATVFGTSLVGLGSVCCIGLNYALSRGM